MFGLDAEDFWVGIISLIVFVVIVWAFDQVLVMLGILLAFFLGTVLVAVLGRVMRIALGDVEV